MMRTTTPLAAALAIYLLQYYDLYVQLVLWLLDVDASFGRWHYVAGGPRVGVEYLLPAIYLIACYAVSESVAVVVSVFKRALAAGISTGVGEGIVVRAPSNPEG